MTIRAKFEQLINDFPSTELDVRLQNIPGMCNKEIIAILAQLYRMYDWRAEVRHSIINVLARSDDFAVVPTLIEALEDGCIDIQRTAARGLARYGREGLTALLRAIAFERHRDDFYRAAHHALFLLQFHSPLHDRHIILSLLAASVGPEPSSVAAFIAFEVPQG